MTPPLVQRPRFYNFFPQPPRGFLDMGHHKAKRRYLGKLKREYSSETVNLCPVCSGTNFILLATQERHGLPIAANLCLGCALAFNSPRLSQETLTDHYRKDYREIERGTPKNLHPWMFDLQASKVPHVSDALVRAGLTEDKVRRIADVGCGEGGLMSRLYPNSEKIGFELNQGAAEYGRGKGLNIISNPLSKDAGRFDLIVYEQVLEHVYDLNTEIFNIADMQNIGAFLYIGVPGLLNFPAHYKHNFIDFLEYGHFWHFNLATLEKLLAKHGYKLRYGDEMIRSVFEKVSDNAIDPTLPETTARQVTDLISAEEKIFATQKHFLRHIRGYLAYAAMALLCRATDH